MSPSLDSTISAARRHAAAGAWREVAMLLEPCASDRRISGDDALLYAEALVRSGEQRRALTYLRDVIPGMAGDVDHRTYRKGVNMTGVAAFALGELDEAKTALNIALELATQDDDPRLLAQATNNLGAIANLEGRYEDALWHYRIALPTLQRIGQPRMLAEVYHNLAITCRDTGELDQSDEHERRAIEHATGGSAPRLVAMGRIGRAEVALRRGDAVLAETTARMARDDLALLDDPQNEADAWRLVGAACGAQQRYDEALEALDSALDIARARGYALTEAETLRDRVSVWMGRGAVAAALDDARAAIAIFGRLGATRERVALEQRIAEQG
ncbi:MAG: tetratricopeptide repeat protein [Gemmatimonadales bacterium]